MVYNNNNKKVLKKIKRSCLGAEGNNNYKVVNKIIPQLVTPIQEQDKKQE